MVNVLVIPGFAADQPSLTDIDLAGYLEDKIAQLVSYRFWTPAGVLATLAVDANGRMSPLPAGTTVAATHVRLVDWDTINPGSILESEDTAELTILYLKDAPGEYP
ncbi:MAG: hypothetical protein KKD44_29025 [Proteobacteria bacterium]|nr:hypothetical protein [Pseudomonadota bacterium]